MVGAVNRLVSTLRSTPSNLADAPARTQSPAGPPVGMAPQNSARFAGARDKSARARLLNSMGIGRTKTEPVCTGFGPRVDVIVQKSPTLCAQLDLIREHGFVLRAGPADGGTYWAPQTKEIVLAQGSQLLDNPVNVVQVLSHEIGHAVHKINGYTDNNSSLAGYIQSCTFDEGVAIFNEFSVAAELHKAKLTAFTCHTETPETRAIYDQYLKDGDQIKAMMNLGSTCVSKLTSRKDAEGNPETYLTYWTRYHQDDQPFLRYYPEKVTVGHPNALTIMQKSGPGIPYPFISLNVRPGASAASG
jgi:hypothetical protein